MIGSTSWMVPGTYLENARILEGIVDFTELLVYEWNDCARKTLFGDMPGLLEVDMKYTVHLPMTSAKDAKAAVDFFEDARFPIINYVLHPMDGWKDIEWNDRVAVENLKDRIEPHERMVFDVGHHLLGLPFPEDLRPKIVEVHVMGVSDGEDHLSLDPETARIAAEFMKGDPMVNFEIFDLDDLKNSLKVWKNAPGVL